MLTTYQIAKEEYKGLNVFMLDGGMSAEYAVQKSLANLTAGVSHTWQIGREEVPNRYGGTPDFLQQSVQHTVDLYNEYLGKSKKLKTVIIATGVPAVPYLSAAMEAPRIAITFFGFCQFYQRSFFHIRIFLASWSTLLCDIGI